MISLNLNIKEWQGQKWILFAVYILFSVLFLFVINDIIITDPQYFTGGNQNSIRLFRNIYNIIYFIYPFYSFVKIAFIAMLLKSGLAFFTSTEVGFIKLFTLVLLAEFILLIPDFLEIIWFLLIHTDYTMEEVKYFHPFSAYSFIGYENIGQSYDYGLKLSNPFEIFYWFILIIGLKEITGKTTKENFKVVAGSYGLFLLIIVIARYFIFSSIPS